MKNFIIMGKGSLKNPFLGEGGDEKPIYRGDCLKGGGVVGQFADLRGVWWKRGGVFETGVDILMHTMLICNASFFIVYFCFLCC